MGLQAVRLLVHRRTSTATDSSAARLAARDGAAAGKAYRWQRNILAGLERTPPTALRAPPATPPLPPQQPPEDERMNAGSLVLAALTVRPCDAGVLAERAAATATSDDSLRLPTRHASVVLTAARCTVAGAALRYCVGACHLARAAGRVRTSGDAVSSSAQRRISVRGCCLSAHGRITANNARCATASRWATVAALC
jgi:hypothetical protein